MATGVLPVFVGNATRAVSYAEGGDKEYVAGLRLGLTTNTQDTTGEVVAERPVSVTRAQLEDVLARHIATGADITAVCTAAGGDGRDTYFRLDDGGRITDTAYGLHTPEGYRCLNIFVLRTELLIQLVTECLSHNRYSLRRDILQGMSSRLHLQSYVYDGYAAHINTLQSYYDRSMELLSTAVRQALFCPQRPVYGKENDSPSGYIDPDGDCVNSLIADGCDIHARTMVRLNEIFESFKLIRQCCQRVPDGPVTAPMRQIRTAEACARTEAPRGEVFYYIRTNGTDMPARLKWRVPSYMNWEALGVMMRDCKVADVALITNSIDPCVSCTER